MIEQSLTPSSNQAAVRSVLKLFSISTKRYPSPIGQTNGYIRVSGRKGGDLRKLRLSRLPEEIHQPLPGCMSELLLGIGINNGVCLSRISDLASALVLEDGLYRLNISVVGSIPFNKFVIIPLISLPTRRMDEIIYLRLYYCNSRE